MTDAETSSPEAPPLPSLPRRVADVLFSPGRLFAALAREPRWGAALALGAALTTLAVAVIPPELWAEAARQAMLERGQTMPEGFDPESMAGIQKWFGVGGAAISWFIMVFLIAGLTSLAFAFVLGDRGGYRQHLAIVSHALLITALGSLLVTPLRLLQGDLTLSLNLGVFVPLEDGFLAGFLRYLDLFWLWAFVVVGVGAHELDRRRSVPVAVAVALVIPLGVAAAYAFFTTG